MLNIDVFFCEVNFKSLGRLTRLLDDRVDLIGNGGTVVGWWGLAPMLKSVEVFNMLEGKKA